MQTKRIDLKKIDCVDLKKCIFKKDFEPALRNNVTSYVVSLLVMVESTTTISESSIDIQHL